jgi:hypothetical protein
MGKRLAARRVAIVTVMAFLVTAAAMTWPSLLVSAQAPGRTVDQLKEAVLAPDDLGPGFFIVDGSIGLDPPSAVRALFRLSADGLLGPGSEQVYIGLGADSSVDPATVADAMVRSLRAAPDWQNVTVTDRLTADWLATEAVAYECPPT